MLYVKQGRLGGRPWPPLDELKGKGDSAGATEKKTRDMAKHKPLTPPKRIILPQYG